MDSDINRLCPTLGDFGCWCYNISIRTTQGANMKSIILLVTISLSVLSITDFTVTNDKATTYSPNCSQEMSKGLPCR